MSIQSRIAALEELMSLPDLQSLTDYQRAEYEGLISLRRKQKEGLLIEVLDDGFVRMVDYMGVDASVVQAARVSYGAGTKSVSDDRTLVRYLMRHGHTTPFEMCEIKFHVRVPFDCWRQWIRHRTANVNEYSTRYSEAINSMASTNHRLWRRQATTNKQGSAGMIEEWPEGWDTFSHGDHYETVSPDDAIGFGTLWEPEENVPPTPGQFLSAQERKLHYMARKLYEERLELGVAREQARKDLPLSTYTEAYWKMDLHNLLHFLKLRLDQHAQQEIRMYAGAIAEFVKKLYPMTWEAFEDYQLYSMTLSLLEVERLRDLLRGTKAQREMSNREVREFEAKLRRLNLDPNGFQIVEGPAQSETLRQPESFQNPQDLPSPSTIPILPSDG